MKKINIHRIIYRIRNDYMNINSMVILVAIIIASGFVWGSLDVMQRNYKLQKVLDDKKRELLVVKLANENAKLEQRYYNTTEYKELSVRSKLGLGESGEGVLILPKNTDAAKAYDASVQPVIAQVAEKSNFDQWIDFMFGANI